MGDLWRLIALAPAAPRRALALAISWTVFATLADVASLALLNRALATTAPAAAAVDRVAPLVAVILAAMSGSVLRLAALRRTVAAQYGLASALAVIAFERLQRQDYADYLRAGPSQGFTAFERLQIISFQALAPLIAGLAAAGSVLLMLIGLLVVAPVAGLGFVVVALIVASGRFGGGTDAGSRLSHLTAVRARLLHDGRAGFRDVFLTNGQDRLIHDFTAVDEELRHRQGAAVIAGQSARHVLELAGLGLGLAGLATLRWLGATTTDLVPMLGVLALAGLRLLPQLAAMRGAWRTVSAHGQVTSDVLTLLSPLKEPARADSTLANGHPIELEAVTVRREGRIDPLRNLSLVIPRGARIGIAGASGAGKSTLLDVLALAIAPDSGRMLIGGTPVDRAAGRSWRERIGFVSQHPVLLGDTLREAVVFPDRSDEVDDERFDRAVRLSGVEEMTAGFARGLDTPVGEAVEHLSGGQRQRVAMAHALYRARDLLLLDEASGQLDTTSERALIEAISALPDNLSVVLVSHRPALFGCCDIVYELADGQLRPCAESGLAGPVAGQEE